LLQAGRFGAQLERGPTRVGRAGRLLLDCVPCRLGFLCADRTGKEFSLDDEELELVTAVGTSPRRLRRQRATAERRLPPLARLSRSGCGRFRPTS
jgi:hypothetical protein